MKPDQLATLNAGLAPIEDDLAQRMDRLFERCPHLHGFTVLDRNPFAVRNPDELRTIKVLGTVMGGKAFPASAGR